ncbi:hypothetical protein PGW94_00685 [Candidatus Anaplasma sp. TIGMIC]|nr:hypothetical protein [Candidatus Anaplasma sp. TIGMIC]
MARTRFTATYAYKIVFLGLIVSLKLGRYGEYIMALAAHEWHLPLPVKCEMSAGLADIAPFVATVFFLPYCCVDEG